MDSKNGHKNKDRDMLIKYIQMVLEDNAGLRYKDIADILNKDNYKTQRGKKFTCQNIRSYILAEEL